MKMGVEEIGKQTFAIFALYFPSMIYYSYWSKQYNIFMQEISEKYRDKISKKEIRAFYES